MEVTPAAAEEKKDAPTEEKEPVKTEEAPKLQNGNSSKDTEKSAASGVSEEKKKAKSRFMFNIADGGFTGTGLVISVFLMLLLFCLHFNTFTSCLHRTALFVAERGASCHCDQENQRDLAPSS